jgi:oligopeptidase B
MDHYAWLRRKDDPRVMGYLKEENAYTEMYMKSTEGFQEELYQEMLGRILQTDLSVPYLLRGYCYYSRTEEGKQYPIYCRRKESSNFTADSPASDRGPVGEKLASAGRKTDASWKNEEENTGEAREEVLLDLNVLAEGRSFLGLGMFEVSDDSQLLAYATDTSGFRQYTLEVKDLRTRELLPLRVERVTSVAWASDQKTLFYVVEDEVTKRSYQLWRHVLGTEQADVLLYEEKDERFRVDIERTRSGAYARSRARRR